MALIFLFLSYLNFFLVYLHFYLFLFQGKLELKLKSLYNNVETFVIFVGYPRSSHSLIAAILDSHPEIIIPNEFDLLKKFNSSFMYAIKERNRRKLRIFFELHSRSREQAMFGRRSPNRSSKKYWYHIPGSWQGNYKNQLKVNVSRN